MCSLHSAPHTAFFYASREASLAHVVEFLSARDGERVLVMTTRSRWDDISASLPSGAFDSRLPGPRDSLVVADAGTFLDRTVCNGIFDAARFEVELALLMGNGHPPQRFYSEAASALVARQNFPAALALEHAEQEMSERRGTRIACGFDVQQFPDIESDWQIRSTINAHQEAAIEPGAWTRPVAPDSGRRAAPEAKLVLLWDSHPDTRIMYAEALAFGGYRVMTAGDALQAFRLAKRYRPDVLVLDVRLPANRAVATMLRLRARHGFNAPILALTAHAFRQERDDILKEGFDLVLSKPCLPDALVAAIAGVLDPGRDA
jgi:CheY-like chemotaxis protein